MTHTSLAKNLQDIVKYNFLFPTCCTSTALARCTMTHNAHAHFAQRPGILTRFPLLNHTERHLLRKPHPQHFQMTSSSPSSQQVEFYWTGNGKVDAALATGRTVFKGFVLNGVSYEVGDYVQLYPEEPGSSPYLGRLTSCFLEQRGEVCEHQIEVSSVLVCANVAVHNFTVTNLSVGALEGLHGAFCPRPWS